MAIVAGLRQHFKRRANPVEVAAQGRVLQLLCSVIEQRDLIVEELQIGGAFARRLKIAFIAGGFPGQVIEASGGGGDGVELASFKGGAQRNSGVQIVVLMLNSGTHQAAEAVILLQSKTVWLRGIGGYLSRRRPPDPCKPEREQAQRQADA